MVNAVHAFRQQITQNNLKAACKINPTDADSFFRHHDAFLAVAKLREQFSTITDKHTAQLLNVPPDLFRKHRDIDAFIVAVRADSELLEAFRAVFRAFECFEAFWSGDW